MSILWAGAVALGQTPVVYLDTLTGSEAVALVAARTGLPAEQLKPMSLSAILEAPPTLLGAGTLQPCAREPATQDEVRTLVGRARAALASDDIAGANTQLERAIAWLGCLGEVVDASVGAEVFLLRGALRAWTDDLDAAHYEYVSARAFDPRLTWDARLPEAGRAPFDEAIALPADTPLHRRPRHSVSGPWLDGAVLTTDHRASPALHLFQYATPEGIRSGWLSMEGPVTVVVPGSYRQSTIEAVGTPEGNDEFGLLLAGAIPSFEAAYVVHQGGVWLTIREGRDLVVDELAARVPPPEPAPMTRKERRARRREAKKQR